MDDNNDSSELKLRDPAPSKPSESQDQTSELKLQMKPVPPPLELKKNVEPVTLKLEEIQQPNTDQAGQVKKKELPLLVVKKDKSPEENEEKPSEIIEKDTEEPSAGTEERGSAVKTMLQVVVMLVSIAAIIIAGYFIYKQLSPEPPYQPPKKDAAKPAAKTKQDASKDPKKTDGKPASGQKAPAPKKESVKITKVDANTADKGAILKNFADLKMSLDDATKMADEIIAGRPYKGTDDVKAKYKDDKAKLAIIDKAFNSFGTKPKAQKDQKKTDKPAAQPAAKPIEPAKSAEPAPEKAVKNQAPEAEKKE